jgi:homogentisate phytyltransferase / homogentisate geranylgeranyltransferase
MRNKLTTLWQFSRPHTIVGSFVSIVTLFLMATPSDFLLQNFSHLVLTLVSGIACNIFIVGLNQIIDIELDKVNKPQLPLASGNLQKRQAYYIILISLAIAITAAYLTSLLFTFLILVILLIGISYSVPPIQLKRHHLPAAFAITIVRGVLVNLGIFLHFYILHKAGILAQNLNNIWDVFDYKIILLTGFIIAFSIAIAWFKDLSDKNGDKIFNIKTLAVLYSTKFALIAGSILVLLAYTFTIFHLYTYTNFLLMALHIFSFLGFCFLLTKVSFTDIATIRQFYRYFWVFFFLEYIYFAIDAILAM